MCWCLQLDVCAWLCALPLVFNKAREFISWLIVDVMCGNSLAPSILINQAHTHTDTRPRASLCASTYMHDCGASSAADTAIIVMPMWQDVSIGGDSAVPVPVLFTDNDVRNRAYGPLRARRLSAFRPVTSCPLACDPGPGPRCVMNL